MGCWTIDWIEQIAVGIAGGLCVIAGEQAIRWWRHRRHFAPFVSDLYIRTWIDEYHLWETAYMTAAEREVRARDRRILQEQCCFGIIKIRHRDGRTLSTVADYRLQRGIARGVVEFDSTLLKGRGNYRYAQARRDYGRYTVDLNPEQPDTIVVVYKGVIPTNQAEGYEIWTKLRCVTREMFPPELQVAFEKRIAEARESIPSVVGVQPAEF